jgi:hypothetical protein
MHFADESSLALLCNYFLLFFTISTPTHHSWHYSMPVARATGAMQQAAYVQRGISRGLPLHRYAVGDVRSVRNSTAVVVECCVGNDSTRCIS